MLVKFLRWIVVAQFHSHDLYIL